MGLENKLLVGTGCIMRIASISKCLTMAVVAKLWEEGSLDLEASITKYVPDWPNKMVDGQPVDITVRQLCCHLSGVKMYESGTPGMAVAISVNGKQVWQHGFGYSDLENKLLVGTGCIMRIASISKCLTMAVVAKLWEEGSLDLEASITKYYVRDE